jgi:hypothetical protein
MMAWRLLVVCASWDRARSRTCAPLLTPFGAPCATVVTPLMPPFAPVLTPLHTNCLCLSIGDRQYRGGRPASLAYGPCLLGV